jgi:hypothetical protein
VQFWNSISRSKLFCCHSSLRTLHSTLCVSLPQHHSHKHSSIMASTCLQLKSKAIGLFHKFHGALNCKIRSRVLFCSLAHQLPQPSTTKPSMVSRTKRRASTSSSCKIVLLSTQLSCAVLLLPQRSCLAADRWAAWTTERTG